jgi:hypothetical protein
MTRDRGFSLRRPPRHPGVGIASFILGLATPAFLTVSVALLFVTNANPEAAGFAVGQGAFVLFLGNIAGLVMGIVGLAQRRVKKSLALWGTILNALVVCGFLAVLVVMLGSPK